jgi:hypothetical protein
MIAEEYRRRSGWRPCTGCNPANAAGSSPSAASRPAAPRNPAQWGAERVATHIHGPLFGESRDRRRESFPRGCTATHPSPSSSKAETRECSRRDGCARCRGSTVPAADSSDPTARRVAEGIDALLGARFFLIAPRAAKRRIEVVVAQRVQQRLRLQQSAAALGIERNGIGSRRDRRLVAPHQQLRAHLRAIASRNVSISRNLKPVSICSSGKGIGPG